MTAQEIITLLNAGYTKEQIDAMAQPQPQPQPQPQAVEPQPQPQAVEPQPQPQADAQLNDFLTKLWQLGKAQPQPQPQPQPQAVAAQPQAVQLSSDQLTQLIQGVAVQTAVGTIETPKSAETILTDMLNGIVGNQPKED